MSAKKVDLIIHPVRFRILQILTTEKLTTQEIAGWLSDIPKSSIYRHLKKLLDAELVSVAETRLVKGIQEKTYQLAQRPYLSADDMAGLMADDHLRYFTTYLLTVLRGFADYLTTAESDGGEIDLLADRVGYTEVRFFANNSEFDEFQATINEAVLKLMNNEEGNGRRKHKIALITHPLVSNGPNK